MSKTKIYEKLMFVHESLQEAIKEYEKEKSDEIKLRIQELKHVLSTLDHQLLFLS